MDYYGNTLGAMNVANAASAEDYAQVAPPVKLFDAIGEGASHLRHLNARLQGIIDRFSPTPREAGGNNAQLNGRAPYTVAMQDLAAELQAQSALIEQLEKFI